MRFLWLTLLLLLLSAPSYGGGGMLRGIISGNGVSGGGGVSFSDNFDTDTSANWGSLYGTMLYGQSDHYLHTSSGAAAYYKTSTESTTQYVKAQFIDATNGLVLRSTGVGSDGYYVANTYSGSFYVSKFNSSGLISDSSAAAISGGFAAGDTLSVTITGTGAATVVRAWKNTASNTPTAVNGWDSAGDTADATITVSGSPYYDTGVYVGAGINAGSARLDNFYGGGL